MEPICHLPWTWLDIDLDKKIIRNCCKTKWIPDPEFKLFNNDAIVKRRTEFLQGQKSADCSHCWKLEDAGQLSYRQYTKSNVYLQTTTFDTDTDVPSSLSISLGSLCNLSCSYCNEDYSTIWAVEKKIPIKLDIVNHFEIQILAWLESILNSDRLKQIVLIGGEPTINPSFYKILELLKKHAPNRNTPLKISVHTNGMFNESQLTQILNCAGIKNCSFTYRFSTDAVGQRSEFIRKGLEWNKFIQNFETLKQSSLKITVHPTLSIFSLGGLVEFLDWINSYGDYDWEDFGLNHVEFPSELSLRALGIHAKELLPKFPQYKNRTIQQYLVRVILFVNGFKNQPDFSSVKSALDYHSSRSNISKENVVPELIKLLNTHYENNLQ